MIFVGNILYIGSFALIFVALIGVLNFINTDNDLAGNNINENSIQTIDPHDDIKILNNQMIKTGNGIPTVNGQAQNTGSYKVRYVSITVNFYDKNGNLLYSSFDGKSYIAPGETWNFEVPYRKSITPYSYKVEVGPTM